MADQLIKDYMAAFSTEGGKRVLKDLSSRCYENQPTFVDQNPTGSAYREGARGVMLHINFKLHSDPHKEKQLTAKE